MLLYQSTPTFQTTSTILTTQTNQTTKTHQFKTNSKPVPSQFIISLKLVQNQFKANFTKCLFTAAGICKTKFYLFHLFRILFNFDFSDRCGIKRSKQVLTSLAAALSTVILTCSTKQSMPPCLALHKPRAECSMLFLTRYRINSSLLFGLQLIARLS